MASHRRKQRKKNRKNKSYKVSGFNKHHRLPRSRGGSSSSANISIVPKRHHNIYNELFGSNPTAHEVAKILSDTWIDPRYVIVVMTKEEYHAYHAENEAATSFERPSHAEVVSESDVEEACHLGHA